MITFEVSDMTCGHCVGAITAAVRDVDPVARVQADLATHHVKIDTASVPPETLRAAIAEAGYTPIVVGG